jgi:transcriptional regulator with XRE-family HTH domain
MDGKNEVLKFIRHRFRYTQKAMGDVLGLTQSGYSDIENGRSRLSLTDSGMICRVFNIDPDIFNTDLPPTEWDRFFRKEANAENVLREPEMSYKNEEVMLPPLLLMSENDRIRKELQAFKEENERLKSFIVENCPNAGK